jgi:hypothetical protein
MPPRRTCRLCVKAQGWEAMVTSWLYSCGIYARIVKDADLTFLGSYQSLVRKRKVFGVFSRSRYVLWTKDSNVVLVRCMAIVTGGHRATICFYGGPN